MKAAIKHLSFCAANFDWNGKRQQTCMRVSPSKKIFHIPFLGVAVFSEPKISKLELLQSVISIAIFQSVAKYI